MLLLFPPLRAIQRAAGLLSLGISRSTGLSLPFAMCFPTSCCVDLGEILLFLLHRHSVVMAVKEWNMTVILLAYLGKCQLP